MFSWRHFSLGKESQEVEYLSTEFHHHSKNEAVVSSDG